MTDDEDVGITGRRAALVVYAGRIAGNRARAEDVVQEAFLRLEQACRERRIEHPLHYLLRIVRHLALDVSARARREAGIFCGGEAALALQPDDKPSPEAALLSREAMAILQAALDELPARTRMALEMHRLEGAKLKDIAGRLGVSVSVAHRLVVEGVDHCRRRVKGGRHLRSPHS